VIEPHLDVASTVLREPTPPLCRVAVCVTKQTQCADILSDYFCLPSMHSSPAVIPVELQGCGWPCVGCVFYANAQDTL
jgi:hypothetical protein